MENMDIKSTLVAININTALGYLCDVINMIKDGYHVWTDGSKIKSEIADAVRIIDNLVDPKDNLEDIRSYPNPDKVIIRGEYFENTLYSLLHTLMELYGEDCEALGFLATDIEHLVSCLAVLQERNQRYGVQMSKAANRDFSLI